MLPKIPHSVLALYRPLSFEECFYLRTRWRLCPYDRVEALLPRASRILDFGCGYGMLANLAALKDPSRYVVGVDFNPHRLRVARRSIKSRGNIRFFHGSLDDIGGGPYDAVVMTDVLHHIDDAGVKALLDRMKSSLSPGGYLVILDVDKKPFWKFFITYLIDRFLNLTSPLHYRSRQEMGNLLGPAPLSIESIIPVHQGLPLADIIFLCRHTGQPSVGTGGIRVPS